MGEMKLNTFRIPKSNSCGARNKVGKAGHNRKGFTPEKTAWSRLWLVEISGIIAMEKRFGKSILSKNRKQQIKPGKTPEAKARI
jgi:hypothetical protein